MPGVIVIPRREAKRSGWQDLIEAAQPGLNQAMQMYLTKKMEEAKRQRAEEKMREYMPEAFTEVSQTETPEWGKFVDQQAQKGVVVTPESGRIPGIPTKYKFDMSKAPEGASIKFDESGIPQFAYEKPKTNINAYKEVILSKYLDPLTGKIDFSKMSDEEKRFVGALPGQNIFGQVDAVLNRPQNMPNMNQQPMPMPPSSVLPQPGMSMTPGMPMMPMAGAEETKVERIRVKDKKTGQTGTIDKAEFNPKLYEIL